MKNIEPENITLSQLAKYRRQLGLSSKQVADGMRVSLPVVEHIEQGAFEKIGAAPFIRGQVTNYCKYLNLDAADVLSQIPDQLLSHKNVQRPDAFLPASVSKVRLKTNHYGRYAFGTTLLAILSVSAYFVWDKWDLMPGVDSSLQILDSDKETVTYSSILPPVQKVETSSLPESTLVESNDQTDVSETETPNESSESVSADEKNTVESEVPDSDNLLQSSVDEVVPVQNIGSEIVASQFVLEFNLQEEAWVSVKTEAGDNVVQDLIGPGLRRYESNSPMALRIGNADKLTLTINGEAVNVEQFADKNLAKFNWPLGS